MGDSSMEIERLRREVMELRSMVLALSSDRRDDEGDVSSEELVVPGRRPDFVAGHGISLLDMGDTVAISLLRSLGGSVTKIIDNTDIDPETQEPIDPYGTARVVVGWRYETSSHKIQLLYGTIKIVGGALTVEKDHDANGQDLWTDAHQAVEESY